MSQFFALILAITGLALAIIDGFDYGDRLEAFLDRHRRKFQTKLKPYFEIENDKSVRVRPTWITKFEISDSSKMVFWFVVLGLAVTLVLAPVFWLLGHEDWYKIIAAPIMAGIALTMIYLIVGLYEVAVLPLWYVMHILNLVPRGIVAGIGIFISVVSLLMAFA